jgi:hypothetical protein
VKSVSGAQGGGMGTEKRARQRPIRASGLRVPREAGSVDELADSGYLRPAVPERLDEEAFVWHVCMSRCRYRK